MKGIISVNNYSEYWNDFLNGNLSSSDEALLMAFLENNPQLTNSLICDEEKSNQKKIYYPFKETLKSEIISENLIIGKIENQLSKEKLDFINAGIEKDSAIKQTYGLYLKTIQKPDMNVMYKEKANLKKSVLISWQKISFAAAIFLLLCISGILFINRDTKNLTQEKIFTSATETKKDTPILIVADNVDLEKNLQSEKTEVNSTKIGKVKTQTKRVQQIQKIEKQELSQLVVADTVDFLKKEAVETKFNFDNKKIIKNDDNFSPIVSKEIETYFDVYGSNSSKNQNVENKKSKSINVEIVKDSRLKQYFRAKYSNLKQRFNNSNFEKGETELNKLTANNK